jgi:hypothetical protein
VLITASSVGALVPTSPACASSRLRRTTRIVASGFDALPHSPRDELKTRFNRDTGNTFKTPEQYAAEAEARKRAANKRNTSRETQELLEEIRSLMPEPVAEPPLRVSRCVVPLLHLCPQQLVGRDT